jgi:hypothetical protein
MMTRPNDHGGANPSGPLSRVRAKLWGLVRGGADIDPRVQRADAARMDPDGRLAGSGLRPRDPRQAEGRATRLEERRLDDGAC